MNCMDHGTLPDTDTRIFTPRYCVLRVTRITTSANGNAISDYFRDGEITTFGRAVERARESIEYAKRKRQC